MPRDLSFCLSCNHLPTPYLLAHGDALCLDDLAYQQVRSQLRDPAWQQARGRAEALRDRLSTFRFGFIPARFSMEGLFGAMFLHGSFDHLLGNMLFLFIFGFALEIALGRWVYLGLYLLSGVASHLLWWALDPVWVTGVGASGAISGLMGMYIGVYGLRKINFFYWLGPLIGYFKAPALWVLPVWMGKELYGLLASDDHINYYAHLGGLGAGFLAVWLARLSGRLRMDEDYLHKVDPDAPFKRELAALDQLIAQFDLAQAAKRGPDLLNRYPGRLPLLERLYAIASGRQDRALLSALLKQLFALPDSPERLRCRYWLHYAEGSAMPPLLLKLVFDKLRSAPMPFFIKPIARGIANKVSQAFISPQLKLHFDYLESQLSERDWFAGDAFSAADIQLSFPLEAAAARGVLNNHPRLSDFLQRIHARPAYRRALEKGGAYDYAD